MSDLRLIIDNDRAVEWRTASGTLLMRYVAQPDTPLEESPRPYAHPVCSLRGEVLTNFRPNDHPWHHGLSFTINILSGWNFWGGPTYRRGEGYQFRSNHGTQRHVAWLERGATLVAHRLEWIAGGGALLDEERRLTVSVLSESTWSLRWQARLRNVSGHPLACGNYFSDQELAGSHYTGLQFRGARELLDDHGDARVGLFASSGREGETQVHGSAADWLEWRGQKDGSLRRVTIRFANTTRPLHWFVRRHNPLVAFPFQFERNLMLPADGALEIDHVLTFTDQ